MTRVLLILLVACGGKGGGDKPPDPPGKDDASIADARVVLAPAPPLPAPPASLPTPVLPATVTAEAVALGELLFWDTRLSSTGKHACATCHDPAHGYSSGKRMETDEGGRPYARRAPSLVNLAWHKELGWDGRYSTMAEHLDAHMPGQLNIDLGTAVARIGEVPGYRAHFLRLGGEPAASLAAAALEAFVLTRYDGDSPWDRVERGEAPANLKAGYHLFINKAQCSLCHTPPLYTDLRYHRLGLIASPDEGRGRVDPAQKGAFKTPTLRGAATREGHFHDASAQTLDAAIDWHLAGGVGQNADPSIIDPMLKKVTLTPPEREQLGAFVRSLTGTRPAVVKPALP